MVAELLPVQLSYNRASPDFSRILYFNEMCILKGNIESSQC